MSMDKSTVPQLSGMRYQGIDRVLAPGVLSGMLGALAMGVILMFVAAGVQRRGILTPIYEIAALVDPDALAASRQVAQGGNQVYWEREPFIFGIGLHLVVGAVLGMVFALIASGLRLRGQRAIVGGVLYGLVVMLLMTFAVLPLIGRVLGPNSGVVDMPRTSGGVTFVLAHVVFGLVLGYWMSHAPIDEETSP
jgi:hypothetical protein